MQPEPANSMTFGTAKKLVETALAVSDLLNNSLHDINQAEPAAVSLAYRKTVGRILATLLSDVLNPAILKYPELKPKGFD